MAYSPGCSPFFFSNSMSPWPHWSLLTTPPRTLPARMEEPCSNTIQSYGPSPGYLKSLQLLPPTANLTSDECPIISFWRSLCTQRLLCSLTRGLIVTSRVHWAGQPLPSRKVLHLLITVTSSSPHAIIALRLPVVACRSVITKFPVNLLCRLHLSFPSR